MVKKRDDFLEKTKRILQERADNRCSNPLCHIKTSFPNDSGGITRIGEAAHITAASEGGPRFNPKLNNQERKNISNGIWLCNICANKIDIEPNKYTVEILRSWKRFAEKLDEYNSIKPSLRDKYENVTNSQIFNAPIFGGQFASGNIINHNDEAKRKK
ncbi:hypothetical protein RHO13_02210 [Orbus wheelerorum]|uniref:hypothetical protein n=1 Tax=Orbus wheelerorum TaxID=3074111 RepID=UPI00370D5E28